VLILEDEITPVTRSELKAAQDAGLPIFVMLKTGVTRDAELERLIKRIRGEGNTTVNFSSPGELKTRVASALRTLALRTWRARMLERRQALPAKGSGGPTEDDFAEMQVSAGQDGAMITIADLLAQAGQRVHDGDAPGALEELWWVAQGAYDVGLLWLALTLVGEIERVIPAEAIDDRWQGWICNLRGLALSEGSSSAAARAEYERMRQLGKALGDADLESTALQNLGVQDVLEGEHAAAREKFTRSLKLKHELGDWHGGLQVLFNLVNVFVGQKKLDLADRLLDTCEGAPTCASPTRRGTRDRATEVSLRQTGRTDPVLARGSPTHARHRPHALVFATVTGTVLDPDNLATRVLAPACEAAGVEWAGFHTFRHTVASRLFAEGRNVVQVQRWLGHHSASFTLDTYVHLLDNDLGEPLQAAS
jgi:hypothetical protein